MAKKTTNKPVKKSVKAKFKFSLDGKIVNKGEILELSEGKAKDLTERGFTEEV